MEFEPGDKFGDRYQLLSKAGEGGMGEVWKARDTRLDRDVALKVSKAEFPAQFDREARAIAAFNHPNICQIYDVGSNYIVMEWIDGQTLRQKIRQGPFSIPEVLAIAGEILDALAVAHEGGMIHRDLKPENIMLSANGRGKVLDFGLAKRALPIDRTAGEDLTTFGLIVGTPAYMSPEQMRGEKLDFRSDQFSFGAVLYELTTGRKAFPGESMAEVQRAILFRQPEPLTRLNPQAPVPLQWLVERCLAKTACDRYASTSDLRREFTTIVAGTGQRAADSLSGSAIPAAKTPLIGRETELARLRDLMTDPDLRIVTLTGPGGIGKTRLAMEAGRQTAGLFPGGVCFVQLDKVSDAALVPSEVALGLGVAQMPGKALEETVGDRLRQLAGPALLVLDNFEHVLEAAVFIDRLASERLKVLLTRRAPLRVYGEYEFAVPSLSAGRGSERVELAQSPAVRLFLERAPGLRGVANDTEQLRIVSRICSRLDGLPLAIELAAARTRLFPLKTLEARLDDPLAVLVGGSRDLPQRQHTLRATLDWSYNLLDSKHQKLFRRMAVFVGGATIEAVEAVCDTRQDLKVNLWDAIELLVDSSLVRRIDSEDAEPRFALLETMREYGLERLSVADEEAYTRKAHAAYCLVLAEEEAPALRRERTGKHRFDAELGNFRAALDWLATTGEAEWGLRLMMALGLYFYAIRILAESRDILSRLLALPAAERFPRLRNFGLFYEVDFSYEIGGCIDPAGYFVAWRLFEEAGDRQGMLQVANRMAFNDLISSEREQWAVRTVELARETGDNALLAGALSNLADIVKGSNCTYARALYKEAMHLFESSGDGENAIWSLSHQADLYRQENDPGQARALYSEALTRFRQLNFSHGVASCLFDLGGLDAVAGRFSEARSFYRESLRLYGPENPAELPRGIESLAEVAVHCAQRERALTLAGAAAAIRERYHAITRNPVRRAEVAQKIDNARKEAGSVATDWWMKGWNMSIEETLEYALQDRDDTWTTS